MRLLGIDFETTGLDPQTAEITEIGYAIVDTDNWRKPLLMRSVLCTVLGEVPEDIKKVTGISRELLAEGGVELKSALVSLMSCIRKFKVDHIVAHNAPFDRSFLQFNLLKHSVPHEELSWIDTKRDIPWAIPIRNTSLITVAAEHGFLNPFPHAAVFDVFTMLKVLSQYDIKDVLAYRDEPLVFVRALVDYDNRDKAKKRGFSWQECEGKVFEKSWVKALKARHFETEIKTYEFDTKILST